MSHDLSHDDRDRGAPGPVSALVRIPQPTPRRRILVVEDDADMRALLEDYLRYSGFDAESAPDVPAAITYLRNAPVDLVVSDLSSPGESGITFLQKLNGIGNGTPRFIFITAFGDGRSDAEALTLGAHRFVTKPFRMEELVQEIRSALAA